MELAFVIWAVGTLPLFSTAITFLGLLVMVTSGVAWGLTTIFSAQDDGSKDAAVCKVLKKPAGKIFMCALPIWFVFMLVPDKTTSYQMLAAYGVQKVVENPKAQELASDGVDVLSALMKKAKTELTEKTK